MTQPIPLPILDAETDPSFLIDNSSLEVFNTCSRAAQYALALRLRSSGESSALTFGKIMHEILEERYKKLFDPHYGNVFDPKTNQWVEQNSESELMYAKAKECFHGIPQLDQDGSQVYFTHPSEGAVAQWIRAPWTPPADDFRTYSCAVSAIGQYLETYPFEDFKIVSFPDGRPFIEVPFALKLGRIFIGRAVPVRDKTRPEGFKMVHIEYLTIVWTGRIDLVYESSSGGTYPMDHKTTSIMGPSYFESFQLASQFHGYAWATEIMTGREINGVVVNALGIRKPTKTGKAFEFGRQLIRTTRFHKDEWVRDTLTNCTEFINHALSGYFPKRTAWCNGKFGECQFKKTCLLEGDDQRNIVLTSGEYEDNKWSPLN